MFVNDQSGVGPILGPGLDPTLLPNQHARVDLLTAAAARSIPEQGLFRISIWAKIPLAAIQIPTPTIRSISQPGEPGRHLQIRFGEVDNQFYFQQGVDNASVVATIPEPQTVLMMLAACWQSARCAPSPLSQPGAVIRAVRACPRLVSHLALP